MRSARVPASKILALVVYIIVILVATPQAQQPASFTGSPGAITAGPAATVTDATSIDLLVGRSTILNVGATIARVSLTVPDVADAMATTPQQLLIHGKAPGTISMFVWDKAGGIKTYEVHVRRDLTRLVEQVKQLFPGEPIAVTGNGKDVVLSGTVSTKYVVDKAAEVAVGYVEKKEDVVNLLKQQEGVASNQVMLRVRFAEVSRSAMQELGAAYILNGYKNDWYGRATTQQFPAPDFDSSKSGGLTFSDYLNLFVFNTKQGLGAVVKALSSKGLFQSLAEPNLIATNGKEASFLAGGEYPYPVAQPSSGGGTSISVQFKEFGIRLSFTPTVLANDLINLKVKPEVSSLDFSNAIVLNGFRLPALSTRRTDTEVELQDGQTFAIAGLLNNTLNNTMQKIPGIGDIPVLGYLFRSRAYQKNQTELVVMITPTIVRRGSTGVSAGLPSLVEPYLGTPDKSLPNAAPYTGSPRYPSTQPNKGGNNNAPAPVPSPVEGSGPQAAVPVAPQPAGSVKPEAHASPAAPQPATRPLSKEEMKRSERARAEEQRQSEEAARVKAEQDRQAAAAKADADRKAAEQKRLDDIQAARENAAAEKKAEAEREQQQRLDQERAKREAVVAKKNAELAKKKQDEQKKHDKALAEAAARLKQAQADYQAQVEKAKSNDKGSNDKGSIK